MLFIFQKINFNFLYKNICENIEIEGTKNSNNKNIKNHINNFCESENKNLKNIFYEIKKDPWIEELTIYTKIPNTLKIKIKEHIPFFIYNENNKLLLIDENNTKINIPDKEIKKFYNLLYVSGENSLEDIDGLFNIFSLNRKLFSKIQKAIKISKRRWNFILENNIIVKMPENKEDFVDAWNKLDKILSIKGIEINLKVIDLRNKNKIFLEETN